MGREKSNFGFVKDHNNSEKMSGFAKLFGGGKNKQPTPQEAIQMLRETEDMLTKKADFLEKRIEQELASAKKHGTKNKRAALNALKRKKRLEKQQEQIDGTLTTIGFQDDVDEDDLLAELEEMEQEELDKELVGIGSQPVPDLDLPAPGTSIPAQPAKQQEDDELDELAAWAT